MESFDTTKKYYKGNLVLLGKKNSSQEKLIASYNYLQRKLVYKEDFTDQEKMILSSYLNAIIESRLVTRTDIISIFSNLFDNKELSKLNVESVVLPIIYTKENGMVARELLSRAIFPILSDENIDFDYYLEVEDYPKESTSDYKVSASSRINYPGASQIKIALVSEKEATLEEAMAYQNMFKGLFGTNRKKKMAYQEKILELSQKNGPIKVKERSIRQDIRLSLMEKIEYELSTLESKELAKELEKNYETLKQGSITVEGLISILNEIEVIKTFNLDYRTDILGYISRLKEKYLVDLKNNVNEEFNMAYVEQLTGLFYKQQNSYSAMEKRTAEVDLSYIYLIEVYKNKDTLDINTLENSYFKELLKTIVLCLKALEKEEIITLGEINLEDELNVSKVFDYIKSVEIKEHSKNK